MKGLCVKFCHQELLARLRGDTVPQQIEDPDNHSEHDFYEQEESEEDE